MKVKDLPINVSIVQSERDKFELFFDICGDPAHIVYYKTLYVVRDEGKVSSVYQCKEIMPNKDSDIELIYENFEPILDGYIGSRLVISRLKEV